MKKLTLLISIFFGVQTLALEQGISFELYHQLSFERKKDFHQALMKVMERRTLGTRFRDSIIEERLTSSVMKSWDFWISTAHADVENAEIFCNFGGWISEFDDEGECLAPWSSKVRENSVLSVYGPVYNGEFSCGGAKLFRCNPIIFGQGPRDGDGKGFCATADDRDPRDSTTACIELYEGGGDVETHINELKEDPEKLANYLGIASEVLRFCQKSFDDFPYCDQLTTNILNTSGQLVSCENRDSLLPFMPDIVTPFNLDELDSIAKGLGSKTKLYLEELRKKQIAAVEKNKEVLNEAIESYSVDPRTSATLERLRNNSKKCLIDSCKGTRHKNSKPSSKSVAFCARYVKFALFPYGEENAFGEWADYPWSTDAVESGAWLKEMGFTNLMARPEMSQLTPENAPKGAIIVYEDVSTRRYYNVDGQKRGGPGHIEIKGESDEYMSDFINDEPTRIGGLRKPIGIYIKIKPKFEEAMVEVPEL